MRAASPGDLGPTARGLYGSGHTARAFPEPTRRALSPQRDEGWPRRPQLRSPGPRSSYYFGGRALTMVITASRTVVIARVSSLGRTCAHFRGNRDAMSKERRWAPLA